MPAVPQKIINTEPDDKARLALSIYALDQLDPQARARVSTILDGTKLVRPTERKDDAAVEFRCDLLQAAVIVDSLRSEDRRQGDPPTKVWLRRPGEGWEKVPDSAVLTSVVDGKPVLAPWVTGRAVAQPLVVGKVRLGGGA